MFAEKHEINLTTAADGSATAYSASLTGEIRAVAYTPGTSPLDAGADVVVTGEVTGLAIASLTDIGTSAVQWAPRQATSGVTGAAALYAAGGAAVNDIVVIAGERVKVVVAQGGDTRTGRITLWLA